MIQDIEMTDDAVYAEVSRTLAAYAFALRETGYRSRWHRFKCRYGEPEARKLEAKLEWAEAHARKVVNATPAHRTALRIISSKQPAHIRQKDNFEALCEPDK